MRHLCPRDVRGNYRKFVAVDKSFTTSWTLLDWERNCPEKPEISRGNTQFAYVMKKDCQKKPKLARNLSNYALKCKFSKVFPLALSLRWPGAAAVAVACCHAHYKPIKGVSRDSDGHIHICLSVCLTVCLTVSGNQSYSCSISKKQTEKCLCVAWSMKLPFGLWLGLSIALKSKSNQQSEMLITMGAGINFRLFWDTTLTPKAELNKRLINTQWQW